MNKHGSLSRPGRYNNLLNTITNQWVVNVLLITFMWFFFYTTKLFSPSLPSKCFLSFAGKEALKGGTTPTCLSHLNVTFIWLLLLWIFDSYAKRRHRLALPTKSHFEESFSNTFFLFSLFSINYYHSSQTLNILLKKRFMLYNYG